MRVLSLHIQTFSKYRLWWISVSQKRKQQSRLKRTNTDLRDTLVVCTFCVWPVDKRPSVKLNIVQQFLHYARDQAAPQMNCHIPFHSEGPGIWRRYFLPCWRHPRRGKKSTCQSTHGRLLRMFEL